MATFTIRLPEIGHPETGFPNLEKFPNQGLVELEKTQTQRDKTLENIKNFKIFSPNQPPFFISKESWDLLEKGQSRIMKTDGGFEIKEWLPKDYHVYGFIFCWTCGKFNNGYTAYFRIRTLIRKNSSSKNGDYIEVEVEKDNIAYVDVDIAHENVTNGAYLARPYLDLSKPTGIQIESDGHGGFIPRKSNKYRQPPMIEKDCLKFIYVGKSDNMERNNEAFEQARRIDNEVFLNPLPYLIRNELESIRPKSINIIDSSKESKIDFMKELSNLGPPIFTKFIENYMSQPKDNFKFFYLNSFNEGSKFTKNRIRNILASYPDTSTGSTIYIALKNEEKKQKASTIYFNFKINGEYDTEMPCPLPQTACN